MAGVASGVSNGILSEQVEREALTHWRSSEQLESGTPSTSPPFWNTDDDDDDDEDSGLRPSKLYKKYTWAINKFSQINKRELKSDEFEVGGYKWYILIYPQGCDVCNHLSLFLCVANHDKLLPGWSHFAQFTIAVDNKNDPKKAKQSDTLHRFWKKEHDWGWKKFMELSKVLDGFIQEDTLTIHAKVQVIRDKQDRLFRCLACDYRRELVGVYLNNVEGICRKFVDESRSKLGKLIEDKTRWSSFCAFWLGIDQKSRRSMTRERSDLILRAVVKQFFIDKEVTSTLVMDSLYSGLKSLEAQIKTKKARCKLLGTEQLQIPLVCVDKDMFVLVDDVLLLLERAALEPLPQKDDKGPQNQMKDENSGDESIKKANEQRLTELGRRTIEMFVLSHVFSKIEVAYQEAVALERQEELIREEAVWLETEQKSKRVVTEKEKKSKKKQVKQKRNNRKGKDKVRDDSVTANAMDKLQLESKDSMDVESKPELENPETLEDVSDSEETESSPVNWDAEAPFSVQNGKRESNNGLCIVVDDSSSTCSTDSVPSMVMNGSLKANSRLPNHDSHKSPTRKMNKRDKATSDISGWINEENIRPSESKRDVGPQNSSSGSRKDESELESSTKSLQDKIYKLEPQVLKKQLVSQRTDPIIKDQADTHRPLKEKTTMAPSASISSSIYTPSPIPLKLEQKVTTPAAKISIKRPGSDGPHLTSSVTNSVDVVACSRSEPHKSLCPPKPYEKPVMQEVSLIMSRPLSAPVVPGPRPTTPVVSMVQSQPLLLRSVSAVGRLSPDPTPGTHHHQSYRNAMMGTKILTSPSSTSSGFSQPQSPNAGFSVLQSYPTPANLLYPPMFPLQQNDIHALDPFPQVHSRSHVSFPTESPACTSGRQSHGLAVDEFPHLDIINDLLDDEYGNGNFKSQHLSRQFSYPGDIGMANDMVLGPSTSSSGYQRTRSYHENGFQPSYSTHDFYPQSNLRPFLNGQMDGYVPNQWQVAGSDLSYLSTRTSESGGYPYHIPDYSNLASNSNTYNMFRPSNGQ